MEKKKTRQNNQQAVDSDAKKMKIEKVETKTPKFEKVEMVEPTVQDLINAQRASGENQGTLYEAALLASICTFDGKRLTMEDVKAFSMDDFFQLKDAMLGGALTDLVNQLLSSTEQAASTPKQY